VLELEDTWWQPPEEITICHHGTTTYEKVQPSILNRALAASPDPNPEEIIDTLPEELQSLYREALEFTERADPSTESESLDHRILALEETRSYTATATLEEKRQIALALLFFHFGGDDEDPEKKKLKMEMQEAQDPTAELLALLERLLEKNHHLSMQVLRRAQ
jgi:hypothetical protein